MLRRMLRHASSFSEEHFQPEPLIKSEISIDKAGDVCNTNQSATIYMVDSAPGNVLGKEKSPAKAVLFERA